MNERWKDLIKQAVQEIGPEDNSGKEETLKRYAELIVRECVDKIEVWEKDSRNHISYLLKKHFGVE